jgi:SPP1 gp7 family putative phage head morphogenesis protein
MERDEILLEKGTFQPNFVTFTNTEIIRREPIEGIFEGNQNGGFNYVTFADGSGGIEKQLKDWHGNKTGNLYKAELLALQEYLSARVGEVMNAPIRDCRFTNTDAKTIVMPYIDGKTGKELDKENFPTDAPGTTLRLFDYLTANADRRPKNLMFTTDGRIVGIDHALCNFRPRKLFPEQIAHFWNHGVNVENLQILRPKLANLQSEFTILGVPEKFQNMMNNLDNLIDALKKVSDAVVVEKDAFTPPRGVQEAAKRALEWLADGKAGVGFTSVGRKRASDLARGAQVSEKTLRRMKAYFDRHQPDKDSPHWNEPSPGKVAWYAWGGDAGYSWAKKMVAHFNREDEVQKGDVAGHVFHGNQYQQVGGNNAPKILYHGSPADPAKLMSQGIKGSKSRLGGYKGSGIKYVSMTDNPILARGFGKNVLTIDPAGMKFLDLKNAFTIGRSEPTWAGELQAIRNLGLPEYARREIIDSQFKGGEIDVGTKEFRSALKADGYDGVVFDSVDVGGTLTQGAKEYRIFSDVKPEQITGTQDVVAKGDVAGHSFHGNQWVKLGVEGAILRHNKDIKQVLEGNQDFDIKIVANTHDRAYKLKDSSKLTYDGATKLLVTQDLAKRLGAKFDDKLVDGVIVAPNKTFQQLLDESKKTDYIKVASANEHKGGTLYSGYVSKVETNIFDGKTPAEQYKDYKAEIKAGDGNPAEQIFRANDPALRDAVREMGVSQLITNWAQTSNGSSPTSLAMQQAVADQFSLKNTADWEMLPELKKDVADDYAQNGEMYRAIAQAQYDSTQELLKSQGIDEVQLFRGYKFLKSETPDWAKQEGLASVSTRPLSSFSSNMDKASEFAFKPQNVFGGEGEDFIKPEDMTNISGAVITGMVPADKIFSLPTTGFGYANENEVTVLGDTQQWQVLTSADQLRNIAPFPADTVKKGDVQGHEFHGNQYQAGQGGVSEKQKQQLIKEANKTFKFSEPSASLKIRKTLMSESEQKLWSKEQESSLELKNYLMVGFSTLNPILRETKVFNEENHVIDSGLGTQQLTRDGATKMISAVDSALSKNLTDSTIYVGRSVGYTAQLSDLKIGSILNDKSYQSTTVNPDLDFKKISSSPDMKLELGVPSPVEQSSDLKNQVAIENQIVYTVPAGVPYVFRPALDSSQTANLWVSIGKESEVLLGRDLSSVVTNISYTSNGAYNYRVIYATIIPPTNTIPPAPIFKSVVEKAKKTKEEIGQKNTKKIHGVLITGAVGLSALVNGALKKTEGVASAKKVSSIVNNTVTSSIKYDSAGMADALNALYDTASKAGIASVAKDLGLTDAKAGGFIESVLGGSESILAGIEATTIRLFTNAITSGIERNLTAEQITSAIDEAVNNTARAEMIAMTEANRAYNAGILDAFTQAGVTQFNWVVQENGCKDCAEQEGAHDVDTDVAPPLHPNCQCSIQQVVAKSIINKNKDVSEKVIKTSDYAQEAYELREDAKVAEMVGEFGDASELYYKALSMQFLADSLIEKSDDKDFDPDEVNPLWNTPEGREELKKYSQDQPRDENGRFSSSGSVVEKNPANYIASAVNSFTEAGGKVESHDLSEEAPIIKEGKDIAESYGIWAQSLKIKNDPFSDEYANGVRLQNATTAMENALGGDNLPSNGKVLIATDKAGEVVGALSYVVNQDTQTVSVGFLGTTQRIEGAGTALQYELLKVASSLNNGEGGSVLSSVGYGSVKYHEHIGRNIDSNGVSSWTADQVKSILGNVQTSLNVQKGDVAGHAFHGNQYQQVSATLNFTVKNTPNGKLYTIGKGGQVVYRGVGGLLGMRATQSGELGRGIFGRGIYTTTSLKSAQWWAKSSANKTDQYGKFAEGGNGAVVRGLIKEGTTFLDPNDQPDSYSSEGEKYSGPNGGGTAVWALDRGAGGVIATGMGDVNSPEDYFIISDPSKIQWDSEPIVQKGDVVGHSFHGNQYETVAGGGEDYHLQHQAPSNNGDDAPLHALEKIFPPDIYSNKAIQYYGTGNDKADQESMKVINAVRGNPDAIVTIYRGLPKGVNVINEGDWVTLSKTYAEQHVESNIQGGHVISMQVPARTIFTDANSINEFGYDPSGAVQKGDVAGHEFHGNQWTQIGGHTADERPKKWAKAIISELQAGRSPNIGQNELGILLKKVEEKQLEGSLTADITNLRIDGTNLMGQEGLGYKREEMPQIPPTKREEFVQDLASQGISTTKELVDPRSLQPSQSEIGLAHVAHLYTVAEGQIPQTKYLLASSDNYVVDGHHNWAADVAIALNDPTQQVPILRVDAPAVQVISIAHQWATDHGYESVPLGKGKVRKGDVAGHEFHGNQYTGDRGGKDELQGNRWIEKNVSTVFHFYGQECKNLKDGEAKDALYSYVSNSKNVNDSLRGTWLNQFYHEDPNSPAKGFLDEQNLYLHQASLITNLINNSVVSKDVTVYRGFTSNEPFKEGQIVNEKGFTSTSLHETVGVEFANGVWGEDNNADGNGAIFSINVPQGTNAIGITGRESELLLGANSSIQIDKINYDSNGIAHVKATYLGTNVAKGDVAGHDFHGNQYTGGRGGAGDTARAGHFLPLKSTEVVEKLGNKSILGGIQNTGFTKVKLADGSIGIIKHGMKQEEADGEVLSAKIGQALDVPIRDAVIIKTTTAGGVTRCDVLSPFIDGQTLNETSRRSDPDSISPDLLVAQIPNVTAKTENDYAKLQMLDEVIGNPDRNGGNVMVVGDTKSEPWNSPTDPHIIGIDHGMSFSYDPYASEIVFGLEQAGYTDAQVQQANEKMQAIASDATVPASVQDRFLNGVLPAWTEAVKLYKSRK